MALWKWERRNRLFQRELERERRRFLAEMNRKFRRRPSEQFIASDLKWLEQSIRAHGLL